MKTEIIIYIEELTKEDIQLLLQKIRDCEQEYFPDKEMVILLFVPELSTEECTAILSNVRPSLKYGPFALGGRDHMTDVEKEA